MFGPVASDPTVSRLIDKLAAAGPKALTAIRSARADVRERVWKLAGALSPDAAGQVIVDLDGVLVLAHSEKQDAAATWKKTYRHHPLIGFVDHGSGGTGEPVATLLRPGNAGSNTAADHITTTQLALAQLPKRYRRGRHTLIRTDSAGGTHEFLTWLSKRGGWLSYSVGMTITEQIHQAVLRVPDSAWSPTLADRITMQADSHALLAVTTLTREECVDDEDYEQLTEFGREFRTTPAGVHDAYANLSIGNLGFEEHAAWAHDDPEGIYRSF